MNWFNSTMLALGITISSCGHRPPEARYVETSLSTFFGESGFSIEGEHDSQQFLYASLNCESRAYMNIGPTTIIDENGDGIVDRVIDSRFTHRNSNVGTRLIQDIPQQIRFQEQYNQIARDVGVEQDRSTWREIHSECDGTTSLSSPSVRDVYPQY